MNLMQAVEGILEDMKSYLDRIEDECYAAPLDILSESSIGQHTRHVIEFFECLLEQSLTGTVNYDKRTRNEVIQQYSSVATDHIDVIIRGLRDADFARPLNLEMAYDANTPATTEPVATTFEREVVYNIEHAIHHMALIKIGLKVAAPQLVLPAGFGVAPSTIRFKAEAR